MVCVHGSGSLPHRIIEGINKPFNDGTHIIFVNGAYNNPDYTSDLAKLVHDFRCTKADDMYIKELADRTRQFKETPEGVSEMCEKIEDMRKLAMEQGRAEGKAEAVLETIISLVKDGLITIAERAKRANITVSELEARLAQE